MVDIVKEDVLDIHAPALSATSDMPVIETKPDSQPSEPEDTDSQETEPAGPSGETDEQDTAAAPDQSSGEPPPKKAKGVQKRLDELTRLRKEAEEREAATRAQLDQALAALSRSERPPAAKPNQDEQAPNPDDFETPDAFEQANIAYLVRQEAVRLREEERQRETQAQAQEAQRLAKQVWGQREAKAKEKYADYDDIAKRDDVQVSPAMAHAIALSEYGPDIAYHLGKHPETAEQIAKLDPVSAVRAIGRIEAELSRPAQPEVSKAPPPIKPLKGAQEGAIKAPEEMTSAEYREYWRNRELARRKRG